MTARQFYISLFVISVSLKVQKLPSLIAETMGRNSYFLVLTFLAINLIGICLAFFILKKTNNLSLLSNSNNCFLTAIKKILLIASAVYFLSQAMLLYESIQNLFAHVLFYELPWTLFSLMLAGAVFYLAYTGITNISLGFEFYFVIIFISYVVISIFGGTKADFGTILPFENIDLKMLATNVFEFNIWFGDFFLVLFMGKHAKHIKLKWTALVYAVSMLFVCLLYIEFFGIYQDYTPMKPSLISVLSEQSMLGVNIGRIDWFFILFTEIGTIISAGAFLCFSKKCLCLTFPKIKKNHILIFLIAIIYFVDIFYLVDVHTQKQLFMKFLPLLAFLTKVISLLCLFIFCLIKKHKEIDELSVGNLENIDKLKELKKEDLRVKGFVQSGGDKV